ncbi:MAG: recombinase family protein [Actinomycetes bacterium]
MAFDGYVRVSSTRGRGGDSFISPEQQREQISRWAGLRGVTIGMWHEDLDVSGGKVARPGLDLALMRAETGVSEGIVVAKVDRFARSLVGALELIKRLDAAGAQFVSVAEGIDPQTPSGKMLQRLMLILAEFELDRIRDSWNDARRRAVERGVHVSSATPTGYVRGPGGVLEPDPVAAKHVKRAFQMAAKGAEWREIGEMLRAAGVAGPYGQTYWDVRAVTRVVKNPVYTGEARSGEHRNPSAHKALVSRAVFEKASRPRAVMAPRRESTALLAGLIRCAGCQHVMKADRMTIKHGPRAGERARIYRCRREYASGECGEPASIAGWVIEPWVEARFLAAVEDVRFGGSQETDERASLDEQLSEAVAELELFRDQRIVDALSIESWTEGLRVRQDRVDAIMVEMAQHAPLSRFDEVAVLTDAWPTLTVIERRELLGSLMDAVMVRRGRLPVDERALVLWHGELPNTVPKRGRRVPLSQFDWPPS